MPLGLKRYQESRQSHFITFTCYHRLRHLDPAEMKDLVVAMLEQTRRRFSFYVYGFAVMPEHIHLLVSEPQRALLANAIQSFKIAAARAAGTGDSGTANPPRCGRNAITIATFAATRISAKSFATFIAIP